MDKSWITMNRTSSQYIEGVKSFLDFAFANSLDPNVITCPCTKCQVGKNAWFNRDTVTHHLMFNGFMRSYKNWVFHGETIYSPTSSNLKSLRSSTINVDCEIVHHVDATELVNDNFETVGQDHVENDDVGYDFDMADPIKGEDNNDFSSKNEVGQSKVAFSESTANLKHITYKKMREVTKGRVTGDGPRIYAKDLYNMQYQNESQQIMELMQMMHKIKNEIVELKAKFAEQASQHSSQNGVSLEGTRRNGVSFTFGDANSVCNSGTSIEHAPLKTLHSNHTPVVYKQQGRTTLGSATTSLHAQQPSHKRNVEHLKANIGPHQIGEIKRIKQSELNYQELEKMIDKLLIENPKPVKKFIHGDKHQREMSHCYLAGMAIYMCKKRANTLMLDNLLWAKLNKVATKEHVRHPQVQNTTIL